MLPGPLRCVFREGMQKGVAKMVCYNDKEKKDALDDFEGQLPKIGFDLCSI